MWKMCFFCRSRSANNFQNFQNLIGNPTCEAFNIFENGDPAEASTSHAYPINTNHRMVNVTSTRRRVKTTSRFMPGTLKFVLPPRMGWHYCRSRCPTSSFTVWSLNSRLSWADPRMVCIGAQRPYVPKGPTITVAMVHVEMHPVCCKSGSRCLQPEL